MIYKQKMNIKLKIVMYILSFLLFIMGISCFILYYYCLEDDSVKFSISDISYKNGVAYVDISSDDLEDTSYYCAISKDENYKNFDFELVDGVCSKEIKEKGIYYVYVKYKGEIIKLDNMSKVLNIFVDDSKYYVALNDRVRLRYRYISIGDAEVDVSSINSDVAYASNGYVKTISEGTSRIIFSSGELKKEATVVVTDLIDKKPRKYNYDRSYLSCNSFNEKEAKLLDNILFDRVEEAGVGTRAGVVSAVRFLTLEFPYRISYFSENGRLGNYGGGPKVDGEGRFYHKGLYLTNDKFLDLDSNYIDEGPAPWGCSIYSKPSKGMRKNGLDCSGFTTWAIYNGGFDVEDLAAHGGNDAIYNLNDIGEEKELTLELALSDEIKAGDLLGEVSSSEGHSAMVAGVDKDNYYVAEALWEYPLGVNINTYSRREFVNKFETVNLMDSFYKKQGNYASMW